MLHGLDIRDILIIDRLELEFQPGLNVLTGETGAGKSILLDALGFVLGWRGRAELVREGADVGEVTAEFHLRPDHPGLAILEESGIDAEDGVVILRRINNRDGRKTGWINGTRAVGSVLRHLSDTLVELHGQHDDRGLLNPRGHRALLDRFARNEAERTAVRDAWRALAEAKNQRDLAQKDRTTLAKEEDFLRHAVEELEGLDPRPGEEADLDQKRRLMQASERISEDINKAFQALGGEGAEALINDAQRWLSGAAAAAEGQLDRALAALEQSMDALGDAQQEVERSLEALRFDARELEACEERLFSLRAAARKHGVAPDALEELVSSLRSQLDRIDGGAKDMAVLEGAVQRCQTDFDSAAQNLRETRIKAAAALDAAMAEELAPLKMERALFRTQIVSAEAGPDGIDTVGFAVATNPGAPAGPLDKIASGGELSRFLLALKVCLSDGTAGMTMIFDEIDRGVGGATADAVGRRLAGLAEGAQVLVVTHSPQVAALGHHHWRVEKHQTEKATLSTVVPLGESDRIDEIARMISGDQVTSEARAAAEVLLRAD